MAKSLHVVAFCWFLMFFSFKYLNIVLNIDDVKAVCIMYNRCVYKL